MTGVVERCVGFGAPRSPTSSRKCRRRRLNRPIGDALPATVTAGVAGPVAAPRRVPVVVCRRPPRSSARPAGPASLRTWWPRSSDRFVHVPFGLRAPGRGSACFIPDGEDAVLGSLVDDEGDAVGVTRPPRAMRWWPPCSSSAGIAERRWSRPRLRAPPARRQGLGDPGHGGPHRLHGLQRSGRRSPSRSRAFLGARRGGVQPPGRAAGGVAARRARPRRGPGVPGRRVVGVRAGAHVGARPVRVRWPSRDGRRRLRGRSAPPRHHDGAHAPGPRQGVRPPPRRRRRACGPTAIEEARRHHCRQHRARTPRRVEELLAELRALQVPCRWRSAPTATSIWAGRVAPNRVGTSSTSPTGRNADHGVDRRRRRCRRPDADGARAYRSPLADVADMLWSLEPLSPRCAADERDHPDSAAEGLSGAQAGRVGGAQPPRISRRLSRRSRHQRPRPARTRGTAHPHGVVRARPGRGATQSPGRVDGVTELLGAPHAHRHPHRRRGLPRAQRRDPGRGAHRLASTTATT